MASNEEQPPTQPSLVGGHAEYVKGAAEATIGQAIGSHAWTSSGEQAKASGVASMKAASEARDAGAQAMGRLRRSLERPLGVRGW